MAQKLKILKVSMSKKNLLVKNFFSKNETFKTPSRMRICRPPWLLFHAVAAAHRESGVITHTLNERVREIDNEYAYEANNFDVSWYATGDVMDAARDDARKALLKAEWDATEAARKAHREAKWSEWNAMEEMWEATLNARWTNFKRI